MVLLLQMQQQRNSIQKKRGALLKITQSPPTEDVRSLFFFLASLTDAIVEFAGAGATILIAEIVVLA